MRHTDTRSARESTRFGINIIIGRRVVDKARSAAEARNIGNDEKTKQTKIRGSRCLSGIKETSEQSCSTYAFCTQGALTAKRIISVFL